MRHTDDKILDIFRLENMEFFLIKKKNLFFNLKGHLIPETGALSAASETTASSPETWVCRHILRGRLREDDRRQSGRGRLSLGNSGEGTADSNGCEGRSPASVSAKSTSPAPVLGPSSFAPLGACKRLTDQFCVLLALSDLGGLILYANLSNLKFFTKNFLVTERIITLDGFPANGAERVSQLLGFDLCEDFSLGHVEALAHLGDDHLTNHGRQRLPVRVQAHVLLGVVERSAKNGKI